jgi:large subunit ribosomal protein LP2
MRYVAAYLLAVLAGNQSPDLKTVEKILGSVGVESDKARAEKVIKELAGKSIEELIKEGTGKLATVPSGGGAAAPAAAAPVAESKHLLFYMFFLLVSYDRHLKFYGQHSKPQSLA